MAYSPTFNYDADFTSFSNPNYRLEDVLNCNVSNSTDNVYDVIKTPDPETTPVAGTDEFTGSPFRSDLLSSESDTSDFSVSTYQSPMSPGSDGTGEGHSLGTDLYEDMDDWKPSGKMIKGPSAKSKSTKSSGFLGYYAMLESKAKEVKTNFGDTPEQTFGDEVDCQKISISNSNSKDSNISTPDSNDSGIQSDVRPDDIAPHHVHGPLNQDIYAVVRKPKKQDAISVEETQKLLNGKSGSTDATTPTNDDSLPFGWQKYYDDEGAYFWHIKSGTIQRDYPTASDPFPEPLPTPALLSGDNDTKERSCEKTILNYARPDSPEGLNRRNSTVRYAVRSLGWVGVSEEDLTPERSSKAVNKCIIDLSLGRNDFNDVVGRWGDGKDVYMDLDSDSLRLVDPQDENVLTYQPIHSVRVWGVGRDNGRDFAYVARDKTTRKHMCHVFRCDVPARQIANTLRDICKRIMLARSLQQTQLAQKNMRPNHLPNLVPDQTKTHTNVTTFPTPMEEPRKVIHCHYIGHEIVNKPTGMEVLNCAIERAYTKVPPEKWVFADVAIAPSTISIYEHGNANNKIDECRVRFLSFMGIAMKNAKLCAYIMHGAGEQYFAHVFHCEPSAGALCKTIEAACKLRYQKCLDSHNNVKATMNTQNMSVKALGDSIKSGVQKSVSNVVAFVRGITKDVQTPEDV